MYVVEPGQFQVYLTAFQTECWWHRRLLLDQLWPHKEVWPEDVSTGWFMLDQPDNSGIPFMMC